MSEASFDKESNWRARAACLNEDPELFFPVGTTSRADQLQIREAKQICLRCNVRDKCLTAALEADERFGVWGGLSEEEIRALKRRNTRQGVQRFMGEQALLLPDDMKSSAELY